MVKNIPLGNYLCHRLNGMWFYNFINYLIDGYFANKLKRQAYNWRIYDKWMLRPTSLWLGVGFRS
jgi:hypothetical protein